MRVFLALAFLAVLTAAPARANILPSAFANASVESQMAFAWAFLQRQIAAEYNTCTSAVEGEISRRRAALQPAVQRDTGTEDPVRDWAVAARDSLPHTRAGMLVVCADRHQAHIARAHAELQAVFGNLAGRAQTAAAD